MSGSLRCWLVGNGGFYNRGCEAIFRTTVDLITREFDECEFTSWTSDYAHDARNGNVRNVRWRPEMGTGWFWNSHSPWRLMVPVSQRFPVPSLRKKVSSALGSPECVLSIGGDNFSLDYGLPLRFVSQCDYFLRYDIPTVIWSASVGPFTKNPDYEREITGFLRRVSLITARESATITYLDSIGIRDNVVKVSDVAFALEPEQYTGTEAAFFSGDDIVGINVSALILKWYADGGSSSFQQALIDFIRLVIQEGFRVALIPHVSKAGAELTLNDYKFLKNIYHQLEDAGENVILFPSGVPARQVKWIISRCRFFFGARTHATIAAISSGVPTIAIAYSAKARGIWQDVFGHTEYLLDTAKVSTQSLRDKFNLLKSDEKIIRETLSGNRDQMRAGARENAAALFRLFQRR